MGLVLYTYCLPLDASVNSRIPSDSFLIEPYKLRIQQTEFRTDHQSNNLQRKLANDLKEIQQDKHIFVKADKTTNHYKNKPKDYVPLVHKNVTKAYKKTNNNVPNVITSVDKKVAEKLGLDDRIEVSANGDSFITMKDHKPDFLNNPACRLINPNKSDIGIISKQILDHITKNVSYTTRVNQWKSTSNVIQWFKAIPEKTIQPNQSMPSSPSTCATSICQSQSSSL